MQEYNEPLYGIHKKEQILDIYWNISPSMCNKIFKKSLMERFQNKVDISWTFAEDMVCTRLCMLYSESVFITDSIFYHYTRNHGQRKYDNYYIEHIFEIGEVLYNEIEGTSYSKEKKNLLLKGVNSFVVLNVCKFGFGVVFGKANKDNLVGKLCKIKKILKEVNENPKWKGLDEKSVLSLNENISWKLFKRGAIIRLYFWVRFINLFNNLTKSIIITTNVNVNE